MLYVEIADTSSGAAQFAERLPRLFGRLVVPGQAGQKGEKLKLGFDPASAGAETMNGMRFGIGEREGDGSLKRGDQLAQGANGMGGGGHVDWMLAAQKETASKHKAAVTRRNDVQFGAR